MSKLSNNEVVKHTYIAQNPSQVAGYLVQGMSDLVSPGLISMSLHLLRQVAAVVAKDYKSSDPTGNKAVQMILDKKKLLGKLFVLDETTQDCAKLADFTSNDCIIVRYDPR